MDEIDLAEVRNQHIGFVFQQFNLLAYHAGLDILTGVHRKSASSWRGLRLADPDYAPVFWADNNSASRSPEPSSVTRRSSWRTGATGALDSSSAVDAVRLSTSCTAPAAPRLRDHHLTPTWPTPPNGWCASATASSSCWPNRFGHELSFPHPPHQPGSHPEPPPALRAHRAGDHVFSDLRRHHTVGLGEGAQNQVTSATHFSHRRLHHLPREYHLLEPSVGEGFGSRSPTPTPSSPRSSPRHQGRGPTRFLLRGAGR